ncbi:MAG: hypothetical protein ACRCYU_14315, partial [Nocardioides sp.]
MPLPKLPWGVASHRVTRRTAPSAPPAGSDSSADQAGTGRTDGGATANPSVKQMPARTYARLVRLVLGREAIDDPDQAGFNPAETREVLAKIDQDRVAARFIRLVATGVPLDVAQTDVVRELSKAAVTRHLARAFIQGMQQVPEGHTMRAIGFGQILHAMAEFDRAWAYFDGIDRVKLAHLVPLEAITSALSVRTPEATEAALEVAGLLKDHQPATLLGVAGRLVSTGHTDLARDMVEPLRGRRDLEEADAACLRNLVRWTHPASIEAAPQNAIAIGVLDYHQPEFERASANVGDYVQTLAMLGNLVRFQEARFTGSDGLGDLAAELQQRV